MNKYNLDTKKKIIRETFSDVRPIKCITPKQDMKLDMCIPLEGDLFITEMGEFIYLEFYEYDFAEDDLVKFVELAESLYEKNQKKVTIYVVCLETSRVWVKECEIRSEADFTIRLAKSSENQAKQILDSIKMKLKTDRHLDSDDIEMLKMLPDICRKDERSYFLREYFRIISRI